MKISPSIIQQNNKFYWHASYLNHWATLAIASCPLSSTWEEMEVFLHRKVSIGPKTPNFHSSVIIASLSLSDLTQQGRFGSAPNLGHKQGTLLRDRLMKDLSHGNFPPYWRRIGFMLGAGVGANAKWVDKAIYVWPGCKRGGRFWQTREYKKKKFKKVGIEVEARTGFQTSRFYAMTYLK